MSGKFNFKLWQFTKQLLFFGYQQAMSCLFPAVIFFALAVTKVIDIPYIYRYDLILLICLLMQYIMYITRLETADELKVITVFHLIGLCLELFKVHMGSWAYSEPALTKVYGVPLYSGFMYASVASYICQAWRRFDLQMNNWPKAYLSVTLAVGIYLNFFVHHFILDLRWVLTAALLFVFYRTTVSFQVGAKIYHMPVILSFMLIGFFIWVAENISTFFGAWQYPDQAVKWHMVHFGKISSWFLLVIISIIIVAQLKHVKSGMVRKKKSASWYFKNTFRQMR